MTYNTDHVTIVLGHMLKDIHFTAIAVRLEPQMLQHASVGGTRAQAILFLLIKRYHTRFQCLPDWQVLIAEFKVLLLRSGSVNKEIKNDFIRAVSQAYKVTPQSLPVARELVQYIARVCLMEPAFEAAMREASVTKSLSGLRDKLSLLAANQDAFVSNSSVDIINDPVGETGERMQTYIPWMDAMFGGGRGIVKGSTMGIISNQGGGKTTFGVFLGVSQALSAKTAHLVLVEEGMSRSMRCKILGAALGIQYGDIDVAVEKHGNFKAALVEVTQAAGISQDVVECKLELLSKHLKITDAVQNSSYVLSDILAANDKLLSDGEITYMYVDWAGILADRMIRMKGYDSMTKEACLKHIAYEAANYAQRANIILAVSQQLAPLEAKKGAFAVHDMYCSADCKGFTEPMKYAFCINPRDKSTDLSLFQVVKSRDDVPSQNRIVHLQGQYPRIVDVSDNWVHQRKKFVTRGKGKPVNHIPSEE